MYYFLTPLLLTMSAIAWFTRKKKQICKFKQIGDLSSRNKEEIIATLGKPSSESVLVNGTYLLQWQKTCCHIGIIFDRDGNYIRVSGKSCTEKLNLQHSFQ